MTMISRCRSTASNTMHQSVKMMFSSNVIAVRSASVTASANPQHLSPSRSNDSHTCCQNPRSCRHLNHHHLWCRTMSSNSSNSVEPDWVRTAIQKMITDQQQQQQSDNVGETSPQSSLNTPTEKTAMASMNGSPSTLAIFDNPDLEKTLQSLQNQLQEAELCIQDCYECVQNNENPASSSSSDGDKSEMLQKEIDAADHSIDMAVAHFVDLLDAKQHQKQSSSSSTSSAPSTESIGGNDIQNNINKAIPTEDLVKRIKHLRSEIAKLKLVQQQSIVTNPNNVQ